MKTFTFEVDFGYGPKVSDSAVFSLELDDQEISYIKNYLQDNGKDCGYAEIEFNNPSLFDKINDAANEAVVEEINKHSGEKVDFLDVDWTGMTFDFIWPSELTD